MRKYCLFLVVVLVLTLAACGSRDAMPTEESTVEPASTTDTTHIHLYQIADTIGAGCVEGGYTVYACACGDTYHADETEALGHQYGEWITVKEPTEAEEGEARHTCSVCDAEETRVLSKLIPDHTHAYTEEITKAATCSAQGTVMFTCSCGDTYTENTPKTAHEFTDTVTAATCTSGGYTTHTCAVCQYSYVDTRTDSTGHRWGAWTTTKEPTIASTGTAERVCADCGKKETKTLDKLIEDHTHNYDAKTTKEASCTEDGVKTFTCSCGSSYTESISKLGHDYSAKVTAPTCTADGYTTHTCSRCKNTYKDSPVAALGHKWDTGTITTNPTCSKNGVKTFTCGRCSGTKTETLAKLSHDYTESVTEPTCTEKGYTTYTCKNCSHKYRDSETEAVGHDYKTTVTAPTCTEKGYTTNKCSRCGHSYTNNEVPAKGHVNTVTKTVEPTCTEDGYTVTSCADCGAPISTTTIPSSGAHSYTTKMRLSDAVKAEYDRGYTDHIEFIQAEDFDVKVCSGCGDIDIDTMTFRYSDYETSAIMLGYINDFREANGVFPLEIDNSLINKARSMMTGFLQNGYVSGSADGCVDSVDGGKNIRHHFQKFGGTSNEDFLSYNYEYMAYVVGIQSVRETDIYGILLMK